jgi:DNA adenine methylase
LNDANVKIFNEDFARAVADASENDFVYFDPPYDPISDTSSFTGYNFHGFDRAEQQRLKEVCDTLDRRGCKLLLSNSATDFIRNLYSDKKRYTVVEIHANRSINSVGDNRGKVTELLISNNHGQAETSRSARE